MSNIDKQALRNLARRATPGPWTMEHENIWYYENGYTKHLAYFCKGDDVDDSQDDVNTRYVAAADPSTVLALLDELEAKDKQINDLKATEAHSNAGWKKAHEQEARAEAAEKRIADYQELISGLVGVSSSILREVERINNAAAAGKGGAS